MKPSSVALAAIALAASIEALPALASQPGGTISIRTGDTHDKGKVDFAAEHRANRGDAKVDLEITNSDEVDVLVRFPPCTYEGHELGQPPERIILRTVTLEEVLEGAELNPAEQEVYRPTPAWSVCIASRSSVPGVLLVRSGETRTVRALIDFRDPRPAFGDEDEYRLHVTVWADVFTIDAQDSDGLAEALSGAGRRQPAGAIHEYLGRIRNGGSPQAQIGHTLHYRVFPDPGFQRGRYERTTAQALWGDQSSVGQPVYLADGPIVLEHYLRPATGSPSPAPTPEPSPAPTRQRIYGRLEVRRIDHAAYPAWGWTVEANYWDGSGWRTIAEAETTSNGGWGLSFDLPPGLALPTDYLIVFTARNSYVRLQDEQGQGYQWWHSLHATSLREDIGRRTLNCDHSRARGVADVMQAAEVLRDRFLSANLNISLASGPVAITYPNHQRCGGDACANVGQVFLAEKYAAKPSVVHHELGHVLNFEWWTGNFPGPLACGQHNLCTRGNTGIALTEGYASFVADWVACQHSYKSCNVGYGNAEAPGCNHRGYRGDDESWVTATLWDLYDTSADGLDGFSFDQTGREVHLTYLRNGPSAGGACGTGSGAVNLTLDDFRGYYIAAQSQNERKINDVFRQNQTY